MTEPTDRESVLEAWAMTLPITTVPRDDRGQKCWLPTTEQLLDLINRAQGAQRETDARAVESLMPSSWSISRSEMYEHLDGKWVEQALAATAIRVGA